MIGEALVKKLIATDPGGCLPTPKDLEKIKKAIDKLVPISLVDIGGLKVSVLVENVPIAEEHARILSAPEFKEIRINDLPDIRGIRIEMNGAPFDIPIPEGSLLEEIGVDNLLEYALDPAIEQFLKLRLDQLKKKHAPGDLPSILGGMIGYPWPKFPGPVAFCCAPTQFPNLLGSLEDAAFDLLPEGTCLTAKRVDFLVGDQYIEGRLTELPLLGGVSKVIFKNNLEEEITNADWADLAGDVLMVVPIALTPLLPISGGAAIAAWAGTNATFGAIVSGLKTYAATGDEKIAMEQAGKGALIGAVTGVAGGVAVAKVMPAISNQLVAHTAAGGLTGTVASTTEATIRVIEKGESLEEAAKEIAAAVVEGGVVGSAAGAGAFAVTKVVGRLATSTSVKEVATESLQKGEIGDLLGNARKGAYCKSMSDGRFRVIRGMAHRLEGISGVEKNLKIMAGRNYQAGRGAFTELGIADAFKKAGHDVVAVGKVVNIPQLGKTDIDLLTRSGTWIEKKHVQRIVDNQDFRTKIDKMAAAVKNGLEVKLEDGAIVNIREAVFVNSKEITQKAIDYALSEGVMIYQNTPFTRVPVSV